MEPSAFSQPYYTHSRPYRQNHAAPPPPAPPPPAPPPPAPLVYSNPEQRWIKTLFVSGLPDDIKPREIHNLFRRRPGFDFCQLEYTGRGVQVVAFATFFSHQSAIAALSALEGSIFDPETGATLHIELARSNSRKRSRGTGIYTVIDRRFKVTNNDQDASSDDGNGGSDESPGNNNDNSSGKDASAEVKSGGTTNKSNNAVAKSNVHRKDRIRSGSHASNPTLI